MTISSTVLSRRTFARALAATLAPGGLPMRDAGAQGKDQYTFLGLGLDLYVEGNGQRSDVNMIARVDMVAKTVRVLSVPRDLYVAIPGYGYAKINDAYSLALQSSPTRDWKAAAGLAIQTFSQNFELEFDGVALTDFVVFPQVIDAIGGVTVDNPYAIPGFETQYPAGTITMDGEQATMFCRLRPEGDGGRVMRQHLVLTAMLEKLQTPQLLPRIPELVTTLRDVVKTTIPMEVQAELIALIPQLTRESLAFTNIEPLLTSGYSSTGAWIYQGDWSVLPGYVEGWLAGEID